MISAEFDPIQLAALLQTIDRLSDGSWIKAVLLKSIPELSDINYRQYQEITRLPYSQSYVGRFKPSKKRRAGGAGDKGYALDTERLFNDLTTEIDVDADTVTMGSDAEYAGYQEALANDKGKSFFGDDDTYLTIVELALGDSVEVIWGE